MAQTAQAGTEKPLILPPKALKKALADSADRAQRLAQAFNQKVPSRPPAPGGAGKSGLSRKS
jgi:hypothetical protein